MDWLKLAKKLFHINMFLACCVGMLLMMHACTSANAATKVPNEIRVMVIDTGISDHYKLKPYLQFSKEHDDRHGHGTHVTGIILYGNKANKNNAKEAFVDAKSPICENVKIFPCKYYEEENKGTENLNGTVSCIRRAITEKMDIINYSGGGVMFSFDEYEAIKDYVNTGGVFYTVAGNERADLSKQFGSFWPACYSAELACPDFKKHEEFYLYYGHPKSKKKDANGNWIPYKIEPLKNVIVASALNQKGKPLKVSNRHPAAHAEIGEDVFSTLENNQFGYMTGSSQAAPELIHKALIQKCEELKKEKENVVNHHPRRRSRN